MQMFGCFFIFSHNLCSTYHNASQQWRIQDFPEEGSSTPQGGANIQFCQNFPKNTWNQKNLEGAYVLCAPLDPPMLSVCQSEFLWEYNGVFPQVFQLNSMSKISSQNGSMIWPNVLQVNALSFNHQVTGTTYWIFKWIGIYVSVICQIHRI